MKKGQLEMPINFERMGRMISGSKKPPDGHICIFNANVCTKSKGKIWFGDLDLTTDADDLKSLASKMGETLYILREMDARFTNEATPLYEKAVASVVPEGGLHISQSR
jgi:hypothetical protein